MKDFHIENSEEGNRNGVVETGAFSKLQVLSKISLGNSFRTFKTKAFYDLPNLEELKVGKHTISTIESEAFYDLPKLNHLDLSNQLIVSLPSRAFCNLYNLTGLNLSSNMIKNTQDNMFYNLLSLVHLDLSSNSINKIQDNTINNLPSLANLDLSSNSIKRIEDNSFSNLPSLVNLDLSKNSNILHIGTMFSHLQNPDLVVHLAENNVKVLLERSFKPFIETVNAKSGKGYIDMLYNTLQCGCDVKWLLTSNFEWTGLFQNSSCYDGLKLEEVKGNLSMCYARF